MDWQSKAGSEHQVAADSKIKKKQALGLFYPFESVPPLAENGKFGSYLIIIIVTIIYLYSVISIAIQ